MRSLSIILCVVYQLRYISELNAVVSYSFSTNQQYVVVPNILRRYTIPALAVHKNCLLYGVIPYTAIVWLNPLSPKFSIQTVTANKFG